MHIELVLLLTAALANTLLGYLVLTHSRKRMSSWFFAATLFGVALWAVGDAVLLAAVSADAILFGERIFYAAPVFIPPMLLLFALTFPERRIGKGTLWATLGVAGLIATVIALWPKIIIDFVQQGTPLNVPSPRLPEFMLYALYFSVTFLMIYVALFMSMRQEKAALPHAQLLYTLNGAILASVPALLTNLTLPMMGLGTYIWLGPLFTTIFLVAIAMSIVRHRMFDIRTFVVRSVAYILSLGVLAAMFGLIVFGTAQLFFGLHLDFRAQVYISLGTTVAALLFSRLKAFFDRITNSLFYRDAYDTQVLFDRLNRLLVSNTDVGSLLKQSARVLEDTFKAEYCYFAIRETGQSEQRLIGDVPRGVTPGDMATIRSFAPQMSRKVIVVDELEASASHLRQALVHNGVAILGRLTARAHGDEGVGYLVLGARRSGNRYTNKDIRTLGTILNELVIAVENSLRFEQIQHFNETLQESVNEATRKLRKTNEKLQGLDATKDEFITMASHQLRTPLTAVKGYLSMVLEGDAGKLNANQRRLLEQSYVSAQRMVYLIADLLNLSRLGTGKFVIESTPTNLVDVVQSELNQLAQTAASRDVRLAFNYPENFPELMLDETKIHQVVMNFIDNAIYYTPPGGKVTVNLVETPGSVQYIVQDTGIGVPRREQRHLFTKFYRAENARQARPDGTGLGLFMAKKVVAAQGGAIIFESEEGKGSTFGFRFNKRTHAVPGTKEQVSSSK